MNRLYIVFIFITFLFLYTEPAAAQKGDYSKNPKTDLLIEHLEAELEIDDQMRLRGNAGLSVRFLIDDVDSVSIDAVHMEVEDVLVNDRTVDYQLQNEKLAVYFHETFSRNDNAEIRIVYNTRPVFGLLKNYKGTIWTSQLPRTTSHWLPVIDHPRMTMTTDISVTHPSARKLVMNGVEESNEVSGVDTEITRFRSRYPVPVTSLFFGLGEFQSASHSSDRYNIHLYTEQTDLANHDTTTIYNTAVQTLQQMENFSGIDYPHGELHILMMDDVMWEPRTFASGVVLVDNNQSVREQIIYGVMGQWIGVELRELQWNEPEPIQILMGYFAENLDLETTARDTLQEADSVYHATSSGKIEQFRHYIQNHQELQSAVSYTLPDLFEKREYPMQWSDFSRIIYRQTGQPYFEDKPEFTAPETKEEQVFEYQVTMSHDEEENEVRLRFEAEDEAVEELVTVQVKEFTFNEINNRELTFTGAVDEIILNVQAGIENLILSVDERDDIELLVEKPFMFWIHQLQNSEDVENRQKAAEGLTSYTDNPDLQLALLDIIETETNPGVYSAILQTLSEAVDGASGTAQIFLERLSNDQPKQVRLEALRALRNYEGNDQVISRLRSVILSADTLDVQKEAIHSLADVTSTEAFTNITESLIVQEEVLDVVPVLLQKLVQKGAAERAVSLSDTFLSAEFPYSIRRDVLQIVLRQDRSQSGWQTRLDNLLKDRDPRIRFLSTRGLQWLENSERQQLIRQRLIEEFDLRVINALSDYQ